MADDRVPRTGELVELIQSSVELPDDQIVQPGCGWDRPPGLRYPLSALINPLNITMLLVTSSVGMIAGLPWLLPVVLGLDLVAALVMSGSAWFRGLVDVRWARVERAVRARRLAGLLTGLGPEHRQVYERLALKYEEMRQQGGAIVELVEANLEPARLLANYLTLALVYQHLRRAQGTVDRYALGVEINTVAAEQEICGSPDVAAALEQRRGVLRRRAELWDQTDERLQVVQQQLRVIADVLNLLHVQSISAGGVGEVNDDLERCLTELERCEPTINQLLDLEELPAPRLPPGLQPWLAQLSGPERCEVKNEVAETSLAAELRRWI